MSNLPDVRPDQVWADNDKRSAGRTVRVLAVTDKGGGPRAEVEILTNTDDNQRLIDVGSPHVRDMRGKHAHIAVRRFRPNSTGYRLLQDVPAEFTRGDE